LDAEIPKKFKIVETDKMESDFAMDTNSSTIYLFWRKHAFGAFVLYRKSEGICSLLSF
jgi:hypothetical protein